MRGTNRLTLSHEAMREILTEWLARRTSFPYDLKVTEFDVALDDSRLYELTVVEVKSEAAHG